MLGFKPQPIRGYDPVPALTKLGEEATGAGYADLAARAWVLGAELLEARPHTDRQRKQPENGDESGLQLIGGLLHLSHEAGPEIGARTLLAG